MKVACRTLAGRALAPLGVALVLAACSDGRPDDAADNGRVIAARDTGDMMAGMEGSPGWGGNGTREQMQDHLRMMDGTSADSLRALMPMHQQLVENLMAQFTTDVRGRGMTSDSAWTATADSLRHDLTRMPGMSGSEMQQFMPAHGARLRRHMESHRMMMGNMRP